MHYVLHCPVCSCAGVPGAIKNRLLAGVGSGATSLQLCHFRVCVKFQLQLMVFGISGLRTRLFPCLAGSCDAQEFSSSTAQDLADAIATATCLQKFVRDSTF